MAGATKAEVQGALKQRHADVAAGVGKTTPANDHVFLAADVSDFANPPWDLVRGHTVALGARSACKQEAAVHARVALDDGGLIGERQTG